METSVSVEKIAPAFLAAQKVIDAVKRDKTGKIETKTGRNYEYKYSDLQSVIVHVKPPLNENGIAFLQTCAATAGGVNVITRLQHESGEWYEGCVFIPVATLSAQAMGSAITYGKRYGLQSMTGLASEDDDGVAASKPEERPNTATQVAVDAFDELDEEKKAYLHREAVKIIAMFERNEPVGPYVQRQDYDTECKLALWSLLPSKVRTAIKKQAAEAAARSPVSLAEQA